MKLPKWFQQQQAAPAVQVALQRVFDSIPKGKFSPIMAEASVLEVAAKWAAAAGPILRDLLDKMGTDAIDYAEIEVKLLSLLEL